MSIESQCPQCGAVQPEGLLQGLCSRCLARQAAGLLAAQRSAPAQATSSLNSPPSTHLRYFGDYELMEEIARGGMGVVWKARQVSLNRIVAVKMLLAGTFSSPEYVQRFRTEAEAAANLKHPNIVAVHEVGEHAGHQYFSMDYVEGPNFAQLVRENPLPPRRAAAYLETIAGAIHYAHRRGVIHRDLKPANVLLDTQDQPRVTDFGLAKRVVAQASSPAGSGGVPAARSNSGPGGPENPQARTPALHDLTATGQVLGTPGFMPPEQAGGRRGAISAASDVYSLGAILYFLVTGRAPFAAGSLEETLQQVLHTEPASPRLLNPAVPRDLETITLKCLEKDARQRYGSARELAVELGRYLAGKPIHARPVAAPEKLWRWCRRKPVVAALGAALLGAVALGVLGIQWQLRRAQIGELAARRSAYAADMNLVRVALEANNLRRARELLDRHRPRRGQTDLRGWEWRYAWQNCRSDALASFRCDASNSLPQFLLASDPRQFIDRDETRALAPLRRSRSVLSPESRQHSAQDTVLAITPDRQWLAMTGERGVVHLYDHTGVRQPVSLNHSNAVTSLSFSADGGLLAVAVVGGWVAIWDWRVEKVIRSTQSITYTAGYFGDVAFSPKGRLLVIGKANGNMDLIEADTGEVVWGVVAHREPISALAFSPDGRWIASGSGFGDSAIKVWDAATGEPVARLGGHTAWINALAFSPDGRQLASASAEQTVRLWDTTSWTQTRSFRGDADEAHYLAFAPEGRTLLSVGREDVIDLWDTQSAPPQTYPIIRQGRITPVGFSTDGAQFFASSSGVVVNYDAADFRERFRLPVLGANNVLIARSPDGRMLVAGDRDGRLKVWDVLAQRLITNLTAHTQPIQDLDFSRDGRTFFSVGQDRAVKHWRVNDWSQAGSWEWDTGLVPHRSRLLSEHEFWVTLHHGQVKVWNARNGRLIAALPTEDALVDAVACSSDGKWFAAAHQNGSVTLFETRGWKRHLTLRAHITGVHDVAFSPDGSRMVTGNNGRDALKLWDTAIWQELATLPSQGSTFRAMQFSPDGTALIATSQRTKQLWRAPALEEIDRTENAPAPPRLR